MAIENYIVGIVMVLYAAVGLSYLAKGDYPWALTWLCYSGANIGLMWAASK